MKNREELKSAKFMIQNNINKGLDYDLRDNFIKIQGNLLKDKLSAFLLELLVQKNQYFREIESLISEIGIHPACSLDEYETKGFKNRLQQIPQKYGYDLLYSNTTNSLINSEAQLNDKAELMTKHNDKVRCYIDLSVDAILIKTMIDSIDVSQKYPLKLEFASKIGL